jgi:ATP-binding cassette subfamily C protein CydCD
LVSVTDDVRDLVPRAIGPMFVGLAMAAATLITVGILFPPALWVAATLLLVCLVGAPLVGSLADRAASVHSRAIRSHWLRGFARVLAAADDLVANKTAARALSELTAQDARLGAASRRASSATGLGSAIVVLACCLTAVGMMLAALRAVTSGALPVEVVAVLALLPLALIEPFVAATGAAQLWPALWAGLGRLGEFDLDETSRGRGVAGALSPQLEVARALPRVSELELVGLGATWPGAQHPAFTAVTAATRAGEWLIVEGPSGSGKSTMLSVLLGHLPPSSGRVVLDGRDLGQLDPAELRSRVSWCPQDAHLFDSTLRANLLLARSRADAPGDAELIATLTEVGLGDLLARLPGGLDESVGPSGSRLSGGERQRVAVARALLTRADIVLLDEPTAHLDSDGAARMMADLRGALADRIVVVVTHHSDDVEPSDVRVNLGEPVLVIS